MIKLIVGLGNPGRQYQRTRHNAGFWFLDELINRYSGGTWSQEGRFEGTTCQGLIANQKVIFLKPETFMNLSGQSVGKLCRYYKFKSDEILVAHDELDFDAGIVRLKKGGGHAGHNGLRDIVKNLGTNNFYRLRIGIGRPPGTQKTADYVLSDASSSDRKVILDSFNPVYDKMEALVDGAFETVMNQLHSE